MKKKKSQADSFTRSVFVFLVRSYDFERKVSAYIDF